MKRIESGGGRLRATLQLAYEFPLPD